MNWCVFSFGVGFTLTLKYCRTIPSFTILCNCVVIEEISLFEVGI